MLKLTKNCIRSVNILSFHLSSRTYFQVNKSLDLFDHSKKVIILRETGEEYGLASMKVITRDMNSVHFMLQTITNQNQTKNSVTQIRDMTVDYSTFIGLTISLVSSIFFSLFLLFFMILNKYGRKIINTRNKRITNESTEQKKCTQHLKIRTKLTISEPNPIPIDKKNQVESKEPVTPGSIDLCFDFDETEESDHDNLNSSVPIDKSVVGNDDQMARNVYNKKEINAYSTVENLCQLSPTVVSK